MAKTINNWCPQGIVHSVPMDCSFRRNDGKNDNRSNRNGTTLLALDWFIGENNNAFYFGTSASTTPFPVSLEYIKLVPS